MDPKMRYFKIALFWKDKKKYPDQKTCENGILGQKLGFNRCPYWSFFVPRLEYEIFDSTGRRDLNTEYNIFDPKIPECSWCKCECKMSKVIWMGKETTKGYPSSLKKGIQIQWGIMQFHWRKKLVYYHTDS